MLSGGFALRAEILRGVKLRLDGGDDGLGDLVLHGEHVGEVAVVALGPEMAAGGDVVELRGDAHAVAALADAAFEHVAHAELVGDLLQVNGLALVDERGVARDHEEPAQLRQRGDDVLADAVGEILLLRIAAHVGEGQHRDGGPVGQRQCAAAPARPAPAPGHAARCARRRRSAGPCAATVRISRCSPPLSPTAFRAALMRLVRVDSETMRPPQTEAIRSSLLTTRSRFSSRYTSRSNTCGSTATASLPRRSSRRSTSRTDRQRQIALPSPRGRVFRR